MVYSAQWQDDVTPGTSNNPTPIGANGWGIVNWMPQSAGASDTYIHTVQPPGNRNFDVKMSVRRDGASGPLLDGLYQDVIRSEERRVGKECVSTCRFRLSPDN